MKDKQKVLDARRKYQYEFNKKTRKRLVKEHKCIACGKRVHSVIIYHTRCPKCLKKMKESGIRCLERKENERTNRT